MFTILKSQVYSSCNHIREIYGKTFDAFQGKMASKFL